MSAGPDTTETGVRMVEPQYECCLEVDREFGRTRLGLMTNKAWRDDPKRLTFLLARYKFAAKMLAGKKRVLEVGCADAFATRLVQQVVGEVVVSDFDPVFIDDVRERNDPRWPMTSIVHDILEGPPPGEFDGAYSLDVMEHIEKEKEHLFVGNIAAALSPHAVCVIGMPSLRSQIFASEESKIGHVNCKQAPELFEVLRKHFYHVFIFSMNDEVVHTGFSDMAHYFLALCAEPRRSKAVECR